MENEVLYESVSKIKFDEVLGQVGGFGKFQCRMTLIIVAGFVSMGTVIYSLPFLEYIP